MSADDIDSCSLVLFGTIESNALVARLANRQPIELSPDAADYGLLFIAPIGKHYALVNSGLPWWTGADETAGQVVTQGRFDANWKVPADAAALLTAAGTVRIH